MQVSEELKEFLRQQQFAVLGVMVDLGRGPEAVVLVKAAGDIVEGLKGQRADVSLAWVVEATPRGPILCLLVRAAAGGAGELAGETYLDVQSADDQGLLERLSVQEIVHVAFLDEDASPVWVVALSWDEIRRLEVDQVLDRARELLEKTEDYDFEAARDAFQDRMTLDQRIGRAFPT